MRGTLVKLSRGPHGGAAPLRAFPSGGDRSSPLVDTLLIVGLAHPLFCSSGQGCARARPPCAPPRFLGLGPLVSSPSLLLPGFAAALARSSWGSPPPFPVKLSRVDGVVVGDVGGDADVDYVGYV